MGKILREATSTGSTPRTQDCGQQFFLDLLLSRRVDSEGVPELAAHNPDLAFGG